MIHLRSRVALLLVLMLISCGSSLKVRRPFVIVRFDEVSLVVEEANSPEDVFVIQEGDLKFVEGKSLGCRLEGAGRVSVRGLEFFCDPPKLTCQCRGFDISQGTVVIKTDGTLVPANLLPLIAK